MGMEENIRYIMVEDVLPEGHLLALGKKEGIVMRLYCDEHTPKLHSLSIFTFNEMTLLLPLLEQHPAYCPLEVLLASFTLGSTTEKDVQKARKRLYEAAEHGEWDAHLRPLRNVLSHVRGKLRTLGIDVLNIHETGYMLQTIRVSFRAIGK